MTSNHTSCKQNCWQRYKDAHLCLILQNEDRALDSQVNYGVFGNVLVIGGFAAFAFVVRYVLQTMAALE